MKSFSFISERNLFKFTQIFKKKFLEIEKRSLKYFGLSVHNLGTRIFHSFISTENPLETRITFNQDKRILGI